MSEGTFKSNGLWCLSWCALAAAAFWKVGSGNGWHPFFFLAGFSVAFLFVIALEQYRATLVRQMHALGKVRCAACDGWVEPLFAESGTCEHCGRERPMERERDEALANGIAEACRIFQAGFRPPKDPK